VVVGSVVVVGVAVVVDATGGPTLAADPTWALTGDELAVISAPTPKIDAIATDAKERFFTSHL
jgi:hypothetical protein